TLLLSYSCWFSTTFTFYGTRCRGFLRASTTRRRWRRHRLRRRVRLQELDDLCLRTQLVIQQQHEDFFRQLGILRQFRRDAQLRHLGQRQPPPYVPPFSEEIIDAARD